VANLKIADYWSCPEEELLRTLSCSREGLSSEEAVRRTKDTGPNTLKAATRSGGFLLFLRQLKSPVTLILVGAAILSFFLGEKTDAFIILTIIFTGAALGYYQERGAARSLSRLLQLVQVEVPVLREGIRRKIPMAEIVPGDIVYLTVHRDAIDDLHTLLERVPIRGGH